jgi:hypothetical protein
VDGDGYEDLVVGAPSEDGAATDAGPGEAEQRVEDKDAAGLVLGRLRGR